jgi:hypothetical protein
MRGDDVWSGGGDGSLRHYHRGVLRASVPIFLDAVVELAFAGDALVAASNDGTLAVVDANASDVTPGEAPCTRNLTSMGLGAATLFSCGPDRQALLLGLHLLYDGTGDAPIGYAVEPVTRRALIILDASAIVVDADRKVLREVTRAERELLAADFRDVDHAIVTTRAAVWEWTLTDGSWRKRFDVKEPDGVAAAAGAIYVQRRDGVLVRYVDDRPTTEVALGGQATTITKSADGRWLAATLADGSVQLVDATTGQLGNRLEPVPGTSSAAVLDPAGELVYRSGARGLSLWSRRTGEQLAGGTDLLATQHAAWVWPDGSLEVIDRDPARLALPLDRRPVDALRRDIACNVPLRPVGTRLEPTRPTCAAR